MSKDMYLGWIDYMMLICFLGSEKNSVLYFYQMKNTFLLLRLISMYWYLAWLFWK